MRLSKHCRGTDTAQTTSSDRERKRVIANPTAEWQFHGPAEHYFEKLLNQIETEELRNFDEIPLSIDEVSDIVANKLQKEDLEKVMKKLNPQQAVVIKQLYGLDGSTSTKEELAERYFTSIYAINNILGKALRKLRIPIKAQNKD